MGIVYLSLSLGLIELFFLLKRISRKQEQVIEVMCKAALPSTLVKALYLFFDLPPSSNEDVTLSKQKLFIVFQKVTFCFLSMKMKK